MPKHDTDIKEDVTGVTTVGSTVTEPLAPIGTKGPMTPKTKYPSTKNTLKRLKSTFNK